MPYRDIQEVRKHYATLRELVVHNSGGWDDAASRAKVEHACTCATLVLDDAECHERLRTVEQQARELYSTEGHSKWARRTMSGADYLRLQILIALEAINTRLFFIDAMRARSLLAEGHAPEAGLAIAEGGRKGLV